MNPLMPADLLEGPAHDVLLLAGSRPDAARLAPVAAAMRRSGRIEPVLVATGPEPMRVHAALESLAAPPDVTLLLGEPPRTEVGVAAALAVRFDELMADHDPSAVLISGGGIGSVMGAQVAFWNQVPVVYLEPDRSDELLLPFPDGANRRVIGQLTSLILRRADLASPSMPVGGGPNAIVVGDTMATAPLRDRGLRELAERSRTGATRIGLLDAAASPVVAVAADLLGAHPDLWLVFVGTPADPALRAHPRVRVLPDAELPDLLGLVRIAAFGATDDPATQREAVEFGLPTLLVDAAAGGTSRPGGATPHRANVVDPDRAEVLAGISRLLAGHPAGPCRTPDHDAARLAEHALAWMFGLEPAPVAEPVAAPATGQAAVGPLWTDLPAAAGSPGMQPAAAVPPPAELVATVPPAAVPSAAVPPPGTELVAAVPSAAEPVAGISAQQAAEPSAPAAAPREPAPEDGPGIGTF
jgi:UDP-N-acetylglucosamine 2-epimerase (non-hydrolysing)